MRLAGLALVAFVCSWCVGTLVKDLAADPATLSIELTNPLYGTLRVQRSNVQRGSAQVTKDTLTVHSAACPP